MESREAVRYREPSPLSSMASSGSNQGHWPPALPQPSIRRGWGRGRSMRGRRDRESRDWEEEQRRVREREEERDLEARDWFTKKEKDA